VKKEIYYKVYIKYWLALSISYFDINFVVLFVDICLFY